jgi:hypothetical protein
MRPKLIIVIFIAFMLTGCGKAQAEINSKIVESAYSEKTLELKGAYKLSVDCDSSNIEVYCWKKDNIKFEITRRVKGAYEKDVILEKLEDFKIDIKNENEKVALISRYKGDRKSSIERSSDFKIYVPKDIEIMNYKVDRGNIRIFDDIRCSLNAQLNNANLEINRFIGVLNVTGNTGNVKVLGGKMSGSSSVITNNGNISIKSEFDENGEYTFNTGRGHVDIYAPSDSRASFETMGELELNEFTDRKTLMLLTDSEEKLSDQLGKVRISSGIGGISVRKY